MTINNMPCWFRAGHKNNRSMNAKVIIPLESIKYWLTATGQLFIQYTRLDRPCSMSISPDILHGHLLLKEYRGGATITDCSDPIEFIQKGDSFIVACELRDLLLKLDPPADCLMDEPEVFHCMSGRNRSDYLNYVESPEGLNIYQHHKPVFQAIVHAFTPMQ